MAIDINMPSVAPDMEAATLARWLVAVGDRLQEGDVIAEIETDKATLEVEAAQDGVVKEILIPAGTDYVPVGAVIARFLPVAIEDSSSREKSKVADGAAPTGSSALPEVQERSPRDTASAVAAVEDVGSTTRPMNASSIDVVGSPMRSIKEVMLSSSRRETVRRLMLASQVPQIHMSMDVNLDGLLTFRTELNAQLEARGLRVSITDLLVKALATALAQVPSCNVQFAEDRLLIFDQIDIAVGIPAPEGLLMSVIAKADRKSVATISRELNALALRAKSETMEPVEPKDATASMFNLGKSGIAAFHAPIDPPQALMLAVGSAIPKLSSVDGSSVMTTTTTITGSFDRRAIVDVEAVGFMHTLKTLLENPLHFLV